MALPALHLGGVPWISYGADCSRSLHGLTGKNSNGFFYMRKALSATTPYSFRTQIKAFAAQKYEKKAGRVGKSQTRNLHSENLSFKDVDDSLNKFPPGVDGGSESNAESSIDDLDGNNLSTSAARGDVLQTCITTSGLLLALGALLRQVSHIASVEGWPIPDASTEVSFVGFEVSHIELIIGLVILISSCRYILLKRWPDFAESSEAANQQILGSLQPLDYVVVAFLPGISEELLFRGALLPLFGLNWKSALVIGALFGGLHLGSGRKYSFVVWATFVGFVYGLATVISTSVFVPMASHSLNNLIGGILWFYTSNPKGEHR